MADFAKAQLLKYGWKEGKGLGKNENGLTKALKPTLKFDNAGIGYNETNSEHWWEALYDNTIKNVKVEMHEDKISLSKINNSNTIDDSSTISSKKNKKTEQQKYGNFLKSSTLLNGHLIQDISIEKEEKTAKDSIYIPLTDEQLYKACDRYKTTRHDLLNGKLERIAQQDKMFLNVSIGMSQPDANLVKENTMTHRKTTIELDTEESEDPEENQEMIENTSQHETKDFVIISKSARKNHKKRLNKLTQQFSICSLKRNTDSSYNSQHDEELARIKKGKKSQLNMKSGKCSKKRKKNKRKKSLEQKTRISYNTLNETSIDIKDKLKNTEEGVYLSNQIFDASKLKNKVLTTYISVSSRKPINSSSNNLNNKTDKNIHQIILSATKDRNMNIKQDIQQQKTIWEYFDVGKKNFDPLLKKKYLSNSDTAMSFYKSLSKSSTKSPYEQYKTYINNLDDKFHNKDKTIKRKTDQQKQIKKQLEKIINPKNVYTDDLNNVIKKLTTFELTEEVSASVLKKKLTQTHLTPV